MPPGPSFMADGNGRTLAAELNRLVETLHIGGCCRMHHDVAERGMERWQVGRQRDADPGPRRGQNTIGLAAKDAPKSFLHASWACTDKTLLLRNIGQYENTT